MKMDCTASGSFHQASDFIFQGPSAGQQCMASSYVAALQSITWSPQNWHSEDLDELIFKGDSLYRRLKPNNDGYIESIELPSEYTLKQVKFSSIEGISYRGFCSNINTDEDNWDFELQDVLQNMVNCNSCDAGIFTCESQSSCIVYDSINHMFYVFDSHSKDSTGETVADGTSTLFSFKDSMSLFSYLTMNRERVPFELFSIDVGNIEFNRPTAQSEIPLTMHDEISEDGENVAMNEVPVGMNSFDAPSL